MGQDNTISLRLSDDLRDTIQQRAKDKGISQSELLRELIKKYTILSAYEDTGYELVLMKKECYPKGQIVLDDLEILLKLS